MNDRKPGISDELKNKFPQLKPITRVPTLARINGCGVGVYGRRDYDADTRTYVKTYCVSLLFIPIIALGAYRVADAPNGGWYFIGKEPVSALARSGNMAVCVLALVLASVIGWTNYTSSPQYQARQEIKRATALVQAGKPLQAAGIYRGQLFGPLAADARDGLKRALDTCLQSDDSPTVAGALHLLATMPVNGREPGPIEPDAFNTGLTLVEKFRSKTPAGALEILEADAELDPSNSVVAPLQIGLLKQVITANPDDTNHVVELAVIYENNSQLEDSLALLRPYKNRLGATEGARILGRKLLEEQNYADAYGLLFPYVQAHLDQLRTTEISYSNTVAGISHRAIEDLNHGQAGEDFYTRYKAASKDQQDEMVDSYVQSRMQADPGYQQAIVDLKQANRIVPVTLDLGIVQLNRAQELTDPAARKTELEAAEKTFLAIRGFAGESDEYRLFLGQVYYWLGRSQEGRALFDQLLASRKRDFSILMSIAKTLRDVGETTDARNLAEEAYRTAGSNEEKYGAAAFRALVSKEQDEQIAWLEKADPDAAWVQIELNSARGKKALEQANKPLAADYLRKAVAGYETQAKSSAELNNWALACFDLYEATGDVEAQNHGMALFEEAVAIDPGDSILLHNVTYFLISRAVSDVNRDSVNFALLGDQPGMDMLSLLYQDEAGRTQIFQQIHDSEAMKKALGYLDKSLLLAPKEPGPYATALALETGFRDLGAMQKLQQRYQVAAPNTAESKQEVMDEYAGKKDKEDLDKFQKRIQSLKEDALRCATNGNALTLEYINVTLNELEQTASLYGGEVDGQALLQRALDTYQQHESSASRSALQSAYFFAAHQALLRDNPDYAALVKQTRRALGPQYLISYVLEKGGPLADAVGKNEYVIKAVGMEKDVLAKFPSWASVNEWAMLRNVDPQAAAEAARRIKENEMIRLVDSMQFQFSPWNASLVLEQYWTQRMLGDDAHASQVYQTAVSDGVPLPAP